MSQSNGESAGARATAALATARTRGRAVRKSPRWGDRARARLPRRDPASPALRLRAWRHLHRTPRECELGRRRADPARRRKSRAGAGKRSAGARATSTAGGARPRPAEARSSSSRTRHPPPRRGAAGGGRQPAHPHLLHRLRGRVPELEQLARSVVQIKPNFGTRQGDQAGRRLQHRHLQRLPQRPWTPATVPLTFKLSSTP